MDTAPKGEPRPYGSGPPILGIALGDGWHVISIVQWSYHKNPARGAWKGANGTWQPDMWMPLPPAPPAAMKDVLEAQREHDARRRV